jgi:hypothetical protein
VAAEGSRNERKVFSVFQEIDGVSFFIAELIKIRIAFDFQFSPDSECIDDFADADIFHTLPFSKKKDACHAS